MSASVAPQSLQDVLHNVLDYVNTLQLKEGLLISTSNRLKSAFDASPSAPKIVEHAINATLLFGDIRIHVSKMVNIKTKSKYNPDSFDDNVSIHFSVNNGSGERQKVLPQRYGGWFKFIRQLVRLYNPMKMTLIDSDQFTYKDLSATIAELVMVDGEKEALLKPWSRVEPTINATSRIHNATGTSRDKV